MPRKFQLTEAQRARESSIAFAVWLDSGINVGLFLGGIFGGSMAVLAEAIRGTLMWSIEVFALLVMRRIHRGVLVGFEFGVGKLEQIVNLTIATGMLLAAAWVAHNAWEIVAGHREVGSPLGMTLAAVIGAINTLINVVTWDRKRRAARWGGSLIMEAQLRSRSVRLLCSVFVQITMTLAALSHDALIAGWLDATGAVVVAGVLLVAGFETIRLGLPDLLDRSVDETVHGAINRALAQHFDAYDRLDRVRSRRSGEIVFVEVSLAFDARLTVSEVGRRMSDLKATLLQELDGADVSILASSHA
jgi:divalent metal cation (Fe/Co/Zn/Cd) transporter